MIASLELIWANPSGAEVDVSVQVDAPVQVEDGQWTCRVALAGARERPFEIRGGESLQALCLGLALARGLLLQLLDEGGALLEPSTHEELSRDVIDAIFGRRSDLPAIVHVDGDRIADWDSFHDVFAEALSFPGHYGRNMNAWIDCVSDLPSAVTLVITRSHDLRERCPDIVAALLECNAFVNQRMVENGRMPIALALA